MPQTQDRVTQGFVGVWSWCWRRPGLTALEVAWRWAYGVPALLLLRHEGERVLLTAPLDYGALREMTLLDPMRSSVTLAKSIEVLLPLLLGVVVWLVPLLVVVWVVVSSLGRTVVLRQVDARLHARPGTLMALQAVRLAALGCSFTAWFGCLRGAVQLAIAGPIARGEEPSLVLYFALAIAATLGMFVLWATVSWGFAVAPLISMLRRLGVRASLAAAFRLGALRRKLVEINLVMGIVKIALLVLATVFSASPLPFETVTSTGFLTGWWCGVAVLYLVASDFFHVTRLVTCLELWRAHEVGVERASKLKKVYTGGGMSSFAIYGIGVVVIIIGLVYVATLTHVHMPWIVGMGILVLGAGIVGAANNTKKPG